MAVAEPAVRAAGPDPAGVAQAPEAPESPETAVLVEVAAPPAPEFPPGPDSATVRGVLVATAAPVTDPSRCSSSQWPATVALAGPEVAPLVESPVASAAPESPAAPLLPPVVLEVLAAEPVLPVSPVLPESPEFALAKQ